MLHQNRIISPEELIEHIWVGSVNSFSNSIRVHISSLRKQLRAALGNDPIQNKVGQGYSLMEMCIRYRPRPLSAPRSFRSSLYMHI